MDQERNYDYRITFDYNHTSIIIEDMYGEKDVWESKDFVNTKGKVIESYGALWRLAALNYILYMGYPYVEGNHYNALGHFKYFGELDRVINHLNYNLSRKYPFLYIDRKSYRLGATVNQKRLEWVIDCKDNGCLENLYIDRSMISINKQELIDQIIKQKEKSESTNEDGISTIKEGAFYTVTPADDVILWYDKALKKTQEHYNGRIQKIENNLLPGVTVAGTPYDNLPDYICNHYIKTSRRTERGASFAVVEGGAGTGKTYSLYATAKSLIDNKHVAIVVELFELFSKNGKQSLLEYLGQFLTGNNGGETELLFRDLLGKKENVNGTEKTVFIIDGIDEIPLSKYPRLAIELDALARIDNPNVYFILGTRNAQAFTQNSGIEKGITAFSRWDNIKLEPLSLDVLTEDDDQLYSILKKNKYARTPLFVTCFKEIQSLSNEDLRDDDRNFNFKEYIGGGIDFIDEIKDFDNYYDLFNLKTTLLMAHAVKDKVHPIWYSDVLPYVAYYLYTSGTNAISASTLEDKLGITGRSNEDVYSWFRKKINEKYGAFRLLFSKEKLSWLLNTGFIRCMEDENSFRFEHIEYMQFLAAKFASTVIREAESAEIRDSVINDVIHMTSFFEEDGIRRDDKMRNIPFARYIVLDVSKRGQSLPPFIVAERKKYKKPYNRYEACESFDPGYFRIIANVMYEKVDLYDAAKDQIESYMRYKKRIMTGAARNKIEEFEDWRLLYSTNAILYTMITKRNGSPEKWELLQNIDKNLSNCAAIVSREAFASLRQLKLFNSRSVNANYTWEKDFNITSIEQLTQIADKRTTMPDYFGKYRADILGMLYSNLGAVKQEMAKHIHRNRDNFKAYSEEGYLKAAIDYHTHALKFRDAIADKISDNKSVSIIRSLITLGSDEYYYGDYSKEYKDARVHLLRAVNDYHNKALERQGIDPDIISTLDYDTCFPIQRTKKVLEIPHTDAEPHVICLRAAGAYYLLFRKTEEEYVKKVRGASCEESLQLQSDLKKYLSKQYDYLKAAYLFTVEECETLAKDKKSRILDTVKLEINSSEIDNLMKDVEEKYIYSLAHLGEKRVDGKELIKKIYDLYKSLHIYTNKELCWPDEWNK